MDNMPYLIVIGAAVVALAALAALVNYVISIVRGVQEMRRADNPPRNPPLPEEMAKGYATKQEVLALRAELQAERDRVDAILKQQFDLLRELTEKTNQWQLGVERMIGRIEGKVNQK